MAHHEVVELLVSLEQLERLREIHSEFVVVVPRKAPLRKVRIGNVVKPPAWVTASAQFSRFVCGCSMRDDVPSSRRTSM